MGLGGFLLGECLATFVVLSSVAGSFALLRMTGIWVVVGIRVRTRSLLRPLVLQSVILSGVNVSRSGTFMESKYPGEFVAFCMLRGVFTMSGPWGNALRFLRRLLR